MLTRQIKLEGPDVRGTKVNGSMLRDLLTLLIEGSQRSLRVRTQGRSAARGALPGWIAAATEFSVEILEGSTVLQIELPSLFEAAPEDFRQTQLFPEVNPALPAIDYLIDSIEAALEGDRRTSLYDGPFLKFLNKLDGIFGHGITDIEFRRPDGRPAPPLHLKQSSVGRFRELESKIPRPQRVMVAGKLDTIRHSDRTFVLALDGEVEQIRGIAENCEDLQTLWGKDVLVSGAAHFTVNGSVQRVEADAIRLASDRDLSLFAITPLPIAQPIGARDLRTPQGPRSGLSAIFGKWPGGESDEQICEALDSLS